MKSGYSNQLLDLFADIVMWNLLEAIK